eukprot:1890581-Rhodomonas_salina.3
MCRCVAWCSLIAVCQRVATGVLVLMSVLTRGYKGTRMLLEQLVDLGRDAIRGHYSQRKLGGEGKEEGEEQGGGEEEGEKGL